jgi:uncharacterized protein (TIGR03437 family)
MLNSAKKRVPEAFLRPFYPLSEGTPMRLLFLAILAALPACAQLSPFGFEANDGSLPPNVRFIRRSRETPIYITRDAFVLPNRVRIQIANVPSSISPAGSVPSTTLYNYYLGNDPSRWRTGVRLFTEVLLRDIAPGLSASFGISVERPGPSMGVALGRGTLRLNAAPGANLAAFRLNVLNTGASASVGPGGIWFVGGNIPGVFSISATITQRNGDAVLPSTASLKIESGETLSIDAATLNPNLPTEVLISFPNYETSFPGPPLAPSSEASLYRTGEISSVLDFGADGAAPIQRCGSECTEALLSKQNPDGTLLWLTLYGGEAYERSGQPIPLASGVALAGSTGSSNFPLTANAPIKQMRGAGDAFVACFDSNTGRLKNSSFVGLAGSASVQSSLPMATNQLIFGGFANSAPDLGYIARWQVEENRMLFTRLITANVNSLALDATSRILYAAQRFPPSPVQLLSGALDGNGQDSGLASITAAPETASFLNPQVIALPGEDYLLTYTAYLSARLGTDSGRPRLFAAKYSTRSALPLWTKLLSVSASQAQIGITSSGNLKFQAATVQPTAPITTNAELVAQCPDTEYFQIISPSGDLLYASYVPTGPGFAERSEPTRTPAPRLACVAATAGRGPFQAIAPGQMITLTGTGFGPATAQYASLGADGKYPFELAGFRARVAGLDAPIIAVARGLLAIQVPFEMPTNFTSVPVELTEQGRPLNVITATAIPYQFTLFDTGDLNNTLGYPRLAALNQDGTVNGPDNPAAPGSIISLFGSGLGLLSPPLTTGGLNPLPPAAPLSETPLFRAARGGTIEYLGSAPGLSSAAVQLNLRLSEAIPGSGLRLHGIGVAVANSVRQLFIGSASNVIYVR